jgi:hypothetical protein
VTPAALCLALGPIIGLLSDVSGTLALSDRTQASFHPAYSVTGVNLDRVATDFETFPVVGLSFGWRRSSLTFAYAPRFSLRDAFQDAQAYTVQAGSISYSVSSRRSNFTLVQSASYSRDSLVTLALSPDPNPNRNPATPPDPTSSRLNLVSTQTIKYWSEQTSASYTYGWSRDWSSAFGASYMIGGGIAEADEPTPPTLRTATGAASARYLASRNDTLTSTLSVTNTTTSVSSNFWITTLAEGWGHQFSRFTSGTASAGVSLAFEKQGQGSRTTSVFPFAGLSIATTVAKGRSYVVTAGAGTSIVPTVNPLSGDLQARLQGTGVLTWSHEHTSVAVNGDAAQTLGGDAEARIVGLGVVGAQAFGRWIAVSAGYRSIWQSVQQINTVGLPVTSIPRLWIAFAALTLTAPPIKF